MTKFCLRCNKEFYLNRKDKKYCCKTCKQAASVYRMCGANCNAKRKRRKVGIGCLKKVKCEVCGFKPVHVCQLDIDHIDGNSLNNDFSNLQALCANCHRLKTIINKDWRSLSIFEDSK